jgi:membrane-associated protease RseP (regulator of RpoE activity)
MSEPERDMYSYQYQPYGPPQPPPQQYPPQIDRAEEDARIQREIEDLKRKISRFFSVYEVQVGADAIAFYIRFNQDMLEENFESLRNLLKPEYIPVLTEESGEHILYVARKPKVKYKSSKVNVILLLITIITTTIAGSSMWVAYDTVMQGKSIEDINALAEIFSAESLLLGALFFSLPLLLILGTHELGHYFMAKKHGVAASLPFFIPMIPPLGTLGALISMREPIPDKKALIDIGAAGPIAGIIIAIPVTIIGIILTNSNNVTAESGAPGDMMLLSPLLLIGINGMFPLRENVLAHPTFFAGWVGILVTALNLLPAGQLDGGHIVRALFGEKTKYIGMATVITMLFLGFIFSYYGYVILIVLVIVLGGGLRHPPPLNDITALDRRRVMVGVLALIIFVVSFHPAPIQEAPIPSYGFILDSEFNQTELVPGGFTEFNVAATNIGDVENDVFMNATLDETAMIQGWNVTLTWTYETEVRTYYVNDTEPLNFTVGEGDAENVLIRVTSPNSSLPGDNATVTVNMRWDIYVRNDVGETEKRMRRTSEVIVVRVE